MAYGVHRASACGSGAHLRSTRRPTFLKRGDKQPVPLTEKPEASTVCINSAASEPPRTGTTQPPRPTAALSRPCQVHALRAVEGTETEGMARVTARHSSRVGVAWYCEAPSPLLRVCVAHGGLQHAHVHVHVHAHVCIYVIGTTWRYMEIHGDAWGYMVIGGDRWR